MAAAVGDLVAVVPVVGLDAVGRTVGVRETGGGEGEGEGTGVSVGSFVGLGVAGFVGSMVADGAAVFAAVGVATTPSSPPSRLRKSANAPPAARASRMMPPMMTIAGPAPIPLPWGRS